MTKTPSAAVGANVRAEMARRRISQKTLGEHLGLGQVSISARLAGRTPFDVNELVSIAAFLGVTVDVLMAEHPLAEDVPA
jgi:transcriptional regulator with XRE-family HTH domain